MCDKEYSIWSQVTDSYPMGTGALSPGVRQPEREMQEKLNRTVFMCVDKARVR
jgi:hypothetical protein